MRPAHSSNERPSRPRVSRAFCAIVVATLLAGCAGSAVRLIDAVTPGGGYVETPDVAYGDGPRRRLDVYRPSALAADAGAPVVVFFYGGNWREGSKAQYRFVAEALTARGIVAVVADYRLYPEVHYPDFLDDTAAAVAWTVREIRQYGGDPDRIFVAGHSAGAYNAAMIAFDPRWLGRFGIAPTRLRGFVGLAGPYDFLPIENPGARQVFDWPGTPRDSQPVAHIARGAIPSLLIAARDDTTVRPAQNTQSLAAALRNVGADVTVVLHDHVNHVTLIGAMARPLRFLAPVAGEVGDFVLAH